MKASFLASGRQLSLGSLSTLFAAVLVSMLTFVAPARSGVLTLDIIGNGTGSLNSVAFTNAVFDFHLVGPDGSNGVSLTTSEVTIYNPSATLTAFSGPTFVNLHMTPDYAFLQPDTFGGVSGSSDLVRLFFSAADFTILKNSNSFGALATSVTFPDFVNIGTSGGPLTFTSAEKVYLIGSSTGNTGTSDVSAVPELSTWAMMLIGFAGVGLVAYRRTKKGSAAIAAA